MPKNPDRPKARYKPGFDRRGRKKQPPPKLTSEQVAEKNLARLEQRYNITPTLVNAMIAKEHGLLMQVCRALKVPRSTLQRYIERHDECLEAMTAAREAMGDKAERKLFDAIEAGDVRCILYYLSTVHRHRGYGLNNNGAVEPIGPGPVFVETVNIVGVPSGKFLPKEELIIDQPA